MRLAGRMLYTVVLDFPYKELLEVLLLLTR
jgi:hypothetical protein